MPALDDFFSETNEERFFVKNIERVQGDERDAIILSVGYHKDANGNLLTALARFFKMAANAGSMLLSQEPARV